MKNVVVVLGAIVLIAAAFWGGMVYADADASSPVAGDGIPADGAMRGGMGGPGAGLSEEQMAEMQSMTQEERQTFMAEQGIEMPAGGAAGSGMRGGLIQGEVLEAGTDTFTVALEDGGSQTIYFDDDTVIGFAEGSGNFAVGAQVMAFSQSEADGVTLAQAVLVY